MKELMMKYFGLKPTGGDAYLVNLHGVDTDVCVANTNELRSPLMIWACGQMAKGRDYKVRLAEAQAVIAVLESREAKRQDTDLRQKIIDTLVDLGIGTDKAGGCKCKK